MEHLPRDILAAIVMDTGSSKPALVSKTFSEAIRGLSASISCNKNGGRKALILACNKGSIEDVRKVLSICKDAGKGNTKALACAASLGKVDVIALLLNSGAALEVGKSSVYQSEGDPMLAGKRERTVGV